MNICMITHYQGDGSPCASFVHNQAKAYTSLGHHVEMIVILAFGKLDWDQRRIGPILTQATIDGISYHFVRVISLSKYGNPWVNTFFAKISLRFCAPKLFKVIRPDVIHAHTLGRDSLLGSYLKKRLGIPLVITTHGSDTSIPFEQGKNRLLHRFCDGANCVVTVSRSLADKLRSCGIDTPVQVILNGFQSEHIRPDSQMIPHSMIQVGNLIPSKRFWVTMEAVAIVQKRYGDASLTIIGRGSEQRALEKRAMELGITDSVRFLGQIPNDLVLKEMASHQFFIMPSIREGFGIVYLEAMASGCITFGTLGEGIADFIQDGVNGFLVPADRPEVIAEKIFWCLDHPDEAARIANAGRCLAQEQTWEKNAASYCAIFESLKRDR